MTDEQLESKVRSLCDGLLVDEQVDEAIELTRSLPDLETVDPILETLVI